MLQMYFAFFNVEIIRGFTSIFLAIWSATSYPFGFPSRSKHSPLDILKFPVTTFRNQDKKVSFMTCSSPRCPIRSHSLVFSENSLLIVRIGPILNKELKLFFPIWSQYKLEFFNGNWSYSNDRKRVFATYQRMRSNSPSWAGTRLYVLSFISFGGWNPPLQDSPSFGTQTAPVLIL